VLTLPMLGVSSWLATRKGAVAKGCYPTMAAPTCMVMLAT